VCVFGSRLLSLYNAFVVHFSTPTLLFLLPLLCRISSFRSLPRRLSFASDFPSYHYTRILYNSPSAPSPITPRPVIPRSPSPTFTPTLPSAYTCSFIPPTILYIYFSLWKLFNPCLVSHGRSIRSIVASHRPLCIIVNSPTYCSEYNISLDN